MRCDGVTLVVAENGKDGVALAQMRKPDLVLLNIELPDMIGFGVLGALRADPRTEALPIVVVSANAKTSDAANTKELGVPDSWEKPSKLWPFLAEVATLLGLRDTGACSCDVTHLHPMTTASVSGSLARPLGFGAKRPLWRSTVAEFSMETRPCDAIRRRCP